VLGDPQKLAGGGAESRADLNDRALPADRAAGADAQGRGDRLHRRDDRLDTSAPLGDCQHHLRHPVATGFLREAIDDRTVYEPPDHRYQDDEEHPEPGEVRTGDVTGVRIIGATREQFGKPQDEIAEEHCSAAGAGSHGERHRDESRWRAAEPVG